MLHNIVVFSLNVVWGEPRGNVTEGANRGEEWLRLRISGGIKWERMDESRLVVGRKMRGYFWMMEIVLCMR
jgi:hypothetical protein